MMQKLKLRKFNVSLIKLDAILSGFPSEHAFIVDILAVSKNSGLEHIVLVEKILKKLDTENMAPKLEKCKFVG